MIGWTSVAVGPDGEVEVGTDDAAVVVFAPPRPPAVLGAVYPADAGFERLAAIDVARAAAAAARLVEGRARRAVVGDGALAGALRLVFGDDGTAPPAPDALVETTGDAAAIEEAVRDVATLGTVVLAAPALTPVVDVRTYADVHVRGLTVVGCPWANEAGASPPSAGNGAIDELVAWLLDHHRPLGQGRRIGDGLWGSIAP